MMDIRVLADEGRLTGSWLAAHAAGAQTKPGRIAMRAGSTCGVCGFRFKAGEAGHKNRVADRGSFNDGPATAGGGRDAVCAACDVMLSDGRFILKLAYCVATVDGMYPFAKNEERAWFLLNPPEPPFAMAVKNAKQQHVWWRTPVSLSRDLFAVRVGQHVGWVRRGLLAEAVGRVAEGMEEIESRASESARRKRSAQSRHPFAGLDRELISPKHGTLKAPALSALLKSAPESAIRVLAALNYMECWALGNIVNSKAAPTKPERLTTPLEHQPLKEKETCTA